MEKYVMALDAGTTSNRCILFDSRGNMAAMAQKEFTQYFPQAGWVEHDGEEIFAGILEVAKQAMQNAGITASQVAAIGITNQRETTLVWNRVTGKPVCKAIVWQCRRTAQYCEHLVSTGWKDPIRQKTGLVIDPYFSGTKLRWILQNVEGARAQAEAGELLFGTVETWLIWKLTGGKVHITDYSNASRTMLFNIHTLSWDAELLQLLDIPGCMLPTPVPSSMIYGCSEPGFFGGPIPIAGCAGDQQAALFGQTCFAPGDAKCTYGTGAFLLMNTGKNPIASQNGLVTTVAWGLNGEVTYALEGSIFMAGATVQWLRDELRFIESAADSEYMATQVPDTAGCYLVPAFAGLGAPYWDAGARGTLVGLTRGTNRYHIIRAALDAIAYQVCDVLQAMEQDAGQKLNALRVDGGASANGYLMQTQSDLCDAEVVRPKCVETTAMGAAYLAGLATGFWKDLRDIQSHWQENCTFTPQCDETDRENRLKGWKKAVRSAMSFA